MIDRTISHQIQDAVGRPRPKVVLVFGPRRVGKTTLLHEIATRVGGKQVFLNADFIDDARLLRPERAAIERLAGGRDIVFVDEAQQVPDIGRVLKLLHDTYPELRVVASGSASFELRQRTGEPLTGRQEVFDLHPLSFTEMVPEPSGVRAAITHGMIFGGYPEVYLTPDADEKAHLLRTLAAEYLLKDVLALVNTDRTRLLELLRLLAWQIGSEVSYTELAQSAGIDVKTVMRYVDLLEHAFVVFRLGAFSRNQRNEVRKSRKVYFADCGIRNALVNRFAPPELREDVGALWENYLVAERLKRNHYLRAPTESWFWRTYDQQEIDYVEIDAGRLCGYEFKWAARKPVRVPSAWAAAYPDAAVRRIGPDEAEDFIRH